ncbi:hypothetical protein KDA14_02575, partial [Candidatus Saccharibacteria bacterium]|nr:hypothetical protein [Candidatus Saccharibacteria bacterium]
MENVEQSVMDEMWDASCKWREKLPAGKLCVYANDYFVYHISLSDMDENAVRICELRRDVTGKVDRRHKLLQFVLAVFERLVKFHASETKDKLQKLGVIPSGNRNVMYYEQRQTGDDQSDDADDGMMAVDEPERSNDTPKTPDRNTSSTPTMGGYDYSDWSGRNVDGTQDHFYRWAPGEAFIAFMELVEGDPKIHEEQQRQHRAPSGDPSRRDDTIVTDAEERLRAMIRDAEERTKRRMHLSSLFGEYFDMNPDMVTCTGLSIHFFVRHNYRVTRPIRSILANGELMHDHMSGSASKMSDTQRQQLLRMRNDSTPAPFSVDILEQVDADETCSYDGDPLEFMDVFGEEDANDASKQRDISSSVVPGVERRLLTVPRPGLRSSGSEHSLTSEEANRQLLRYQEGREMINEVTRQNNETRRL